MGGTGVELTKMTLVVIYLVLIALILFFLV